MTVNVEVTRNDGENSLNLLRRFSRRIQSMKLVPHMRGLRYFERPSSKQVRKKHALKVIARREEVQELIKLGKMLERTPRRR